MKVLGIETSCDETAVAIITDDKQILSSQILSQTEHAAFGGVVPEIAARAHLEHIDRLVSQALDEANVSFKDLDAIAATTGPGLIGGVMVGMMMGKSIAAVHDLPFISINHLEGHALTVRLTENISFPYLLLLVSGGHSQILIVKGVGQYTRLGTTIDDALGEAFDKCAKILGLGYPGGPAVEQAALKCSNPDQALKQFPLPTPMKGRDNCHFSFSGLKTAMRRHAESLIEENALNDENISALCHAFQHTVGKIMIDRLGRAINIFLAEYKDIANPTLVVAGGVAANLHLRKCLEDLTTTVGMRFSAPPVKLCSDNGAMIAWAGIEHLKQGITHDLDTAAKPRWPLDPDAPIAAGAGIKA